mgnify:FL=1
MAESQELYDMHCHLHEFADSEIAEILETLKGLRVVAVSEDLKSFNRTLDLASSFSGRVVPCAGFHPWSIRDHPVEEVRDLMRLAERAGITCIGEVGLDRRFLDPSTLPAQVKIFETQLETAKELGALVNVHAPDAWREAFDLLVRHGIERALFHWYSGPVTFIDDIARQGYYISINVAIKIQQRTREVAKRVPADRMVFESDGPYDYHGLRLTPLMLPELANMVASLRGVDVGSLVAQVNANSRRLLRI